MEVDLVQTEINSIQAEIVLYQEKQYQTLFIFASHMTVIDWKNVLPEEEKLCL